MARGGNRKREEIVAVAIDKDKGSQHALKWAADRLLSRGETLTLLHVRQKLSSHLSISSSSLAAYSDSSDETNKNQFHNHAASDLFLPFRCFCTRKNIHCNEILLEDMDITKSLINYVTQNSIDVLVLGASSKNSIVRRFKPSDIPNNVTKGAPDFCTVYVISKGKVSSVRKATAEAPAKPPAKHSGNDSPAYPPQHQFASNRPTNAIDADVNQPRNAPSRYLENIVPPSYSMQSDPEIRSPFTRPGVRPYSSNKGFEASMTDSDQSFLSRGRSSLERVLPPTWPGVDSSWYSNCSDISSISSDFEMKSSDTFSHTTGFSSSTLDSENMSWSSYSQNQDHEMEAEMRRLKLELKQTMDMYNAASREAITAKQKMKELQVSKLEEEQKLEEAQIAEEAACALSEKEKVKYNAATVAAEAAQKIEELEARKRVIAEKMAGMEAETNKGVAGLGRGEVKYRKYTIQDIEAATEKFSDALKIGEGGYGPVFRGELDHTQVAIKILRADAAQGRSQFQQEVEVLSCIRHPNMVLLLGACPESGCLVYEYMANGSLEDCLSRKGDTQVLSWQLRFRIAAEIATGLLFLHQAKPEPIVHRDLKPANILLDRNYVSKISDVGLARLVPSSLADSVTQYRMTATAGTFCYIDPEYQQTGLLGLKSDIYSLGVMLLQIITSRPPIGLTHVVERSIEEGNFAEILDPEVHDWPVEEALSFAKLSLQCAEMRRKDRPDLKKVVLPELNRLKALADESMGILTSRSLSAVSLPYASHVSSSQSQDVSSSHPLHSGSWSGSSYSHSSSSTSSFS